MKIVIVYAGPFPNSGNTSEEHVISFSKGLVKYGHEVWVLAPRQSDSSKMSKVDGCFEGINYHCILDYDEWSRIKSLFGKIRLKISSILGIYRFIKDSQADVVLHVAQPETEYIIWKTISRLTKYKYVIERTELPDIYKNEHLYRKGLKNKIYKRIVESSFAYPDVWIVETKTLQDYYKRFAKQDSEFYILPMTVETERFSNIKSGKDAEDYIAYCGNMREDDGVSILIKAFKLIAEKYPSLFLKLAGYSNDTPKQIQLANQLGLKNRIVFLGRIDRDSIPDFLGNAKLLALASPTSLRSCATMPCKVGEYLCTGVPVIVTGLGEINNYLQDGENAYIARPDSVELFAKKMDEALSSPIKERRMIAAKGKQVALKFFSSEKQALTLIDIFTSINRG